MHRWGIGGLISDMTSLETVLYIPSQMLEVFQQMHGIMHLSEKE